MVSCFSHKALIASNASNVGLCQKRSLCGVTQKALQQAGNPGKRRRMSNSEDLGLRSPENDRD